MKKIMYSALCLLMTACSTEKSCYYENCFVTETKVTADMQKIRSLLVDYYQTEAEREVEYDLKFAKVTCKLFGKNNKQLNKEIDKLKKVYYTEEKIKERKKLYDDLKNSLKGLKLDYKQVVLLAKELEIDMAKIYQSSKEKFAPYKARAREIVEFMDKQEEKQDWEAKSNVYYEMWEICNDSYNKFTSYNLLISALEGFISEGILIDSFLAAHPSAISPKDESVFGPYYSVYRLIPNITKHGEIIFDAVKKAVSNKKISKQELSELVDSAAYYMRSLTSEIVDIQHDVTDKIDHNSLLDIYREKKLNNFYGSDRYAITNLVDKNPKLKDFNREIDKLSTRIAYQTYYKVNIVRFLYREWKETYYSEVKELFANAVKLADKLNEMIKDEVITDSTSDKRRYEHKNNLENISNIREIAKIGVSKIISTADCYIDSQEEIKDALNKIFLKIRKAYLKNLNNSNK